MKYTVRLKRSAEKELEDLPDHVHDRIVKRLLALEQDPRPRGVKKLKGRAEEYRLRAGDYRILYVVDDAAQVVEIIAIRHRREAY
ncbi:MAG: type II toxin-antitoxin system RelE/ParE family toxin [Chloroflexi bacterium]|nr:type II toxin-antitoxin system RelE/ParE family toxin [Chloroflexota bacterium]